MPNPIPFTRPLLCGNELRYIQDAVNGGYSCGDGPFTRKCQGLIESVLGVRRALLTPSCTAALEMAAILLELRSGDEVLVPSFALVSTANAFLFRGARPVFVDIRPDTLNLDENLLEARITPRTKAIAVPHYGGIACEMGPIAEIAARRKLTVVEDNAQGILGKYRGAFLGTLGGLATLSFHQSKNFSCGEGGALLLNDARWIERAEIIRDKGTNRGRYQRGQVDRINWVDIGSNYQLSDLLAAHLFAQLECRHDIQQKRKKIWDAYRDGLLAWSRANDVRLPVVPEHCESSYHHFFLLLPTPAERTRLIQELKAKAIQAEAHYLPLHLSDMGRRLGGRPGDCPIAEDVSSRLVRLPFYHDLSAADQGRVIEEVARFQARSPARRMAA
jgi:dTDP-4-amino-4,6-dideoxygalactose transaminase